MSDMQTLKAIYTHACGHKAQRRMAFYVDVGSPCPGSYEKAELRQCILRAMESPCKECAVRIGDEQRKMQLKWAEEDNVVLSSENPTKGQTVLTAYLDEGKFLPAKVPSPVLLTREFMLRHPEAHYEYESQRNGEGFPVTGLSALVTPPNEGKYQVVPHPESPEVYLVSPIPAEPRINVCEGPIDTLAAMTDHLHARPPKKRRSPRSREQLLASLKWLRDRDFQISSKNTDTLNEVLEFLAGVEDLLTELTEV